MARPAFAVSAVLIGYCWAGVFAGLFAASAASEGERRAPAHSSASDPERQGIAASSTDLETAQPNIDELESSTEAMRPVGPTGFREGDGRPKALSELGIAAPAYTPDPGKIVLSDSWSNIWLRRFGVDPPGGFGRELRDTPSGPAYSVA